MSIKEVVEKIKDKVKSADSKARYDALYTPALVIIVAFASFGLGRLSKLEENRMPVTIEYPEEALGTVTVSQVENIPEAPDQKASVVSSGSVMASKNGTKYYLPWCAGVSRINKANLVTFVSKEEAEKAGYSPAGNCKGL